MDPAPRSLLGLLLRSADDGPDGIAVRAAGRSLTYQETARAALAVGSWLREEVGVERGDRVAICLPKGTEILPALYGVMAAGAAYVPLDPNAPARRTGLIARDCSIRALISTPSLAPKILGELEGSDVGVLVAGDGDRSGLPTHAGFEELADGELAAPVDVGPEDLAYILYTSGSTGAPKGVMLTQGNGLAFVSWAARAIGTGPQDVFSNHAPLNFDLAVLDLFVAAWGGATVCPVPEEVTFLPGSLAAFVMEEAITVWYSVPSALTRLVQGARDPAVLSSLRCVVFAGEAYPTPRLRELRRAVPRAALWNLYGPTETNVVTAYKVDSVPDDDTPIPIGRACEGTSLTVVTDAGTIADKGEEGELLVSGPTVTRGYWGDPARTAQVLVPHPVTGETAYRTGDIVRVRADGDLDFVGRRDHQIKSRGYRIELGELEAALVSFPPIAEGVAVALPHDEWGTELVAFVVPRAGEEVTEHDVKRHLSTRLPRYMIPTTIHLVSELDRTSTGKTDRSALAVRHAEAT